MKSLYELSENTSSLIMDLNQNINDAYGDLPQELHKKITELAKELLMTFNSYENSDNKKKGYLHLVECTNVNFRLHKVMSEQSIITEKIEIIDSYLNELLIFIQVGINTQTYQEEIEYSSFERKSIDDKKKLFTLDLELEADKAIKRIDEETKSSFAYFDNEISNSLSSHRKEQDEHAIDLQSRYKSISDDITSFSKKFQSNLLNQLENSANSYRDDLKIESQIVIDELKGLTDNTIENISSKIKDELSDYKDIKIKLEKEFNSKLEKLDSQLSVTASGVMSDQHIKQANTERIVYWILQTIGFLFMISAIYAGSVFFSELTNVRMPFMPKPDLVIHIDGTLSSQNGPVTLMFMRLSMIILLTAPAVYLLKEAALHRHKENLYRQRGIQLATISPYLEELEKEERAMIKKELVSSFFNFHDGKADTQNVPDFLKDMKEAVGIAKSLNAQTKTVSQRFNRKAK
ncbi:hypothetical protein BCU39_011365 [Vibrio cyclitrophicus]|uniref:hypothetical protein n=1 Tax=Vibrio cyclitrophicus TaxID=47951 RepID=UPI0035B9060F